VLGKCRRFYCVYGGLLQCMLQCMLQCVLQGKCRRFCCAYGSILQFTCLVLYVKVNVAGKLSPLLFCLEGSVAVQCV